MANDRNYILLNIFPSPEESAYQKMYRNREETYRQFSARTAAGLPLVSEQEKIFEREEAERKERRLRLFWDSFPIIMRNWKKVLKYPILSNISVDPIGIVPRMRGITLGALVFAWRTSRMRCICPSCHGTAYFVPYVEDLLSRHMCATAWEDDEHSMDFPEKCLIYCSTCGKEDHLCEREHNPEYKCRDFLWRLECWNRCHRPTDSEMIFEHAMHLLKLSEVYKEDPEIFFLNEPSNKHNKQNQSDKLDGPDLTVLDKDGELMARFDADFF